MGCCSAKKKKSGHQDTSDKDRNKDADINAPEVQKEVVQAQQNQEKQEIGLQQIEIQEKVIDQQQKNTNSSQNAKPPVTISNQSNQAQQVQQVQAQNYSSQQEAAKTRGITQGFISKSEKLSLNFQGTPQEIQQVFDQFCLNLSKTSPKQIELQNFSEEQNLNKFPNFKNQLIQALSSQSQRNQNQTVGQEIKNLVIFDYKAGIFNAIVDDILLACPNIEELYIHSEGTYESQGINDEQVHNLEHLKKLQKINLCGNINGSYLNYCKEQRLKSIQLNSNTVKEIIEPYFNAKGDSIEELIIQDIKYTSQIIQKCPNLTQLELVQTKNQLEDQDIQSLLQYPKNLVQLKLINMDQISTQFFNQLLSKKHPDLQILNLTGCKQLSEGCISLITQNCPKLLKLWLCKCVHLTNEAIQELLINSKQLIYLSLEDLNVNSSCLIYDEKKSQFQKKNQGISLPIWKKLTILDVSNCKGINQQYTEYIKSQFPNVTIRQ